jgi:hypothetical protein
MDLRQYVETIQRQLTVAAEAAGDEARAVAERLTAAVDSTVRLTLQDALVAAAEEITCELAPGSVELRLRGRDPEFVVRLPEGFAEGLSTDGLDELGPSAGTAALGTAALGTTAATAGAGAIGTGTSTAGTTTVGTTAAGTEPAGTAAAGATEMDEGATARVNLRLPEQLKARAEQAAANERVSLNAWLVKAVAAQLERAGPPGQGAVRRPARRQRYVGWGR